MAKNIHQIFWADHSLDRHVEILSESIGTAAIPKPEFYAFWREWVERTYKSDPERKEAFIDELAQGKLFGLDIEKNGKVKPVFIKLMLLDIGIAKFDKDTAT